MVNLPGSNEPFSLLKYKEALGKTFARLTLYLGYNEANETCNMRHFLATTDSTNPALNNILTINANAANSDVNGLLATNITTGINTSQGTENRDELILPASSSL